MLSRNLFTKILSNLSHYQVTHGTLINPRVRITRKERIIETFNKNKKRETLQRKKGLQRDDIVQEKLVFPPNYNFEQYKEYSKKFREAQVLAERLEEQKKNPQIPRRRRRVYDKPKFDLDISKYQVWQSLNNQIFKEHDHALKICCKLYVSPKQLRNVFGEGVAPMRNQDATKEYDFQDGDLSQFLVYDYRQTTESAPNKADEYYEDIERIQPRHRQNRRPTSAEFWESEDPQEFRVNGTRYADFRKFKQWFYQKVLYAIIYYLKIQAGSQESFHQKLMSKYPPLDLYDDYDKDYLLDMKPPVFRYDRSYFLEKGEKLDTNKIFNDKINPAKSLGEEFRITHEQYLEIKRQERLELEKFKSKD